MSGTVQSQNGLLTATAAAATAASAAANAAATTAANATSSSASSSSELSSLAGNFNTFLTLLTTQLQNQDPSSPMDSDTFTSEIATFAGVQQQVDTNTNLGQLITLTQDGQATSAASMVGQKASFVSSQIPLQSGTGSISFQTSSPEPIAIAVTNASGTVVRTLQETSVAGANQWNWDGKNNSGASLPDGSYGIAVEAQDPAGNVVAVPFDVIGLVTGVTKSTSGGVTVQFGSVGTDLSTVNTLPASGT